MPTSQGATRLQPNTEHQLEVRLFALHQVLTARAQVASLCLTEVAWLALPVMAVQNCSHSAR